MSDLGFGGDGIFDQSEAGHIQGGKRIKETLVLVSLCVCMCCVSVVLRIGGSPDPRVEWNGGSESLSSCAVDIFAYGATVCI